MSPVKMMSRRSLPLVSSPGGRRDKGEKCAKGTSDGAEMIACCDNVVGGQRISLSQPSPAERGLKLTPPSAIRHKRLEQVVSNAIIRTPLTYIRFHLKFFEQFNPTPLAYDHFSSKN
jgi:hypothetical protein